MAQKKINLEEILKNNSLSFKVGGESAAILPKDALKAMREAVEQGLDIAAERGKVLYKEDGETKKIKSRKLDIDYLSEISAQVSVSFDKESILSVKKFII